MHTAKVVSSEDDEEEDEVDDEEDDEEEEEEDSDEVDDEDEGNLRFRCVTGRFVVDFLAESPLKGAVCGAIDTFAATDVVAGAFFGAFLSLLSSTAVSSIFCAFGCKMSPDMF